MQGSHVLVVGAGLSGLAAADELVRSGATVTLVEAHERLGGRVWTERQAFAAGQHAELGGEFIDADHERMRALARRFDVPLVQVLAGGFLHRYRPAGGPIEVGRAAPWRALEHWLQPLIARYTAAGGTNSAAAVRELARYSLRDWLRQQGAPPPFTRLRGSCAASSWPTQASSRVLPLVQQIAGSGAPAQVTMYRVAGGNDRLIAALAAATPARVLLRHRVREIAHTSSRVTARVEDADGALVNIEADAAVLTIAAPALRALRFEPALPEPQQQAIAALRYGRATKVAIQYRGNALRRRRARAFATDTRLGAFWDASEGQPSTDDAAPSMLVCLGGASASVLLAEGARGGGAGLLSDLCWLDLAGAPVLASRAVTWEDDPLVGGGYAFFDPGFDPAWRPLLSQRAGRIVFAGEHTSNARQGYMEGAVESGVRAARELITQRFPSHLGQRLA